MGNGDFGNQGLAQHMCRFIGQTVTIFTTSGGASGCGFTGVLLSVNPCFARITTDEGRAPSNPLAENICPWVGNSDSRDDSRRKHRNQFGSVCDIPIDKIAAFCHNAI